MRRREGLGLPILGLLGLVAADVVGCGGTTTQAHAPESRTGDGAHWTMVATPAQTGPLRALSLDGQGGVYTIAQGFVETPSFMETYAVFFSHDAGATWRTTPLPFGASVAFGVAAASPQTIYVYGEDHLVADAAQAHPFLAVSTDGGATFMDQSPSFPGVIEAVRFDAQGNVVLAVHAPDGPLVARSTDGGATWTLLPIAGAAYVADLWIAASGALYACGGVQTAPGGGAGGQGGMTGAAGEQGGPGGSQGGGAAGGASPAPTYSGAVFRSLDAGASWTQVATAPVGLQAISGTADEARIAAVGAGYTYVTIFPGRTGWYADSGDPARVSDVEGGFQGIWVADAADPPYITAGNAGEVIRGAEGSAGLPQSVGFEALPASGPGLQSGAIAVQGNRPDDVWAVGAGVFHRTIP